MRENGWDVQVLRETPLRIYKFSVLLIPWVCLVCDADTSLTILGLQDCRLDSSSD